MICIIENASVNVTVIMGIVTNSVIGNAKHTKGSENWRENLKEITKGKLLDVFQLYMFAVFHFTNMLCK